MVIIYCTILNYFLSHNPTNEHWTLNRRRFSALLYILVFYYNHNNLVILW